MATVSSIPRYMTPMTDAAQATGSTSNEPAVKDKSESALTGMGSDAFMKLLTAQMRYQNPMSPKDGTEYMAQISQFAVVEQLQKLAAAQSELGSYQRMTVATSMVGRQVSGTNEGGVAITAIANKVEYRGGKPLIVTDAGNIAFDEVDTVQTVPSTT